jgi:DNA repair protein RadC
MPRADSSGGRIGTAAPPTPAAAKAHYVDHRQRLRDRFLSCDAERFSDYELLELLLFFSIDRIDVKPLAKALLAEFGGLGAVLAAEPARLRRFDRVNDRTCALFKALRETARRNLRADIGKRPVISSWTQLLDYCRMSLADEPTERFRVLFLDRKNQLIGDELQQSGTVDHAPVYPREVVKRALDLGASAIILVHNHPSGDPTPSKADIDITREVRDAAAVLGIVMHDHIVVGRTSAASMKALALI